MKTVRDGVERKVHNSLDSPAIERLVQRCDRPVSSTPDEDRPGGAFRDRTRITAWSDLDGMA